MCVGTEMTTKRELAVIRPRGGYISLERLLADITTMWVRLCTTGHCAFTFLAHLCCHRYIVHQRERERERERVR
jgi:hypothetical protein